MVEPYSYYYYLLYQLPYHALVYVHYDRDENMFYDQCGMPIWNIFDTITPNDLLLFRHNPENCVFSHRDDHETLCWILTD